MLLSLRVSAGMKISIISNYTFSSALPDDLKAIHQYGSESMSAILAQQLSKTDEIRFFAPLGSSRLGEYHPLKRTDGKYLQSDLLEDISLDGQHHTDLLDSFVIDCTPWANNVTELVTYNNFRNYLCYRLGYQDYLYPKLDPRLKHHVTHCDYFKNLYEKAGFRGCQVAHFGLTDFWKPYDKPEPWTEYCISPFAYLNWKDYFLFPHRYNQEKAPHLVLKLAQDFPQETFVFSSAAVLPDHIAALKHWKEECARMNLANVKFIDIPSTPDREYYRRELYRNAKATLSPFLLLPDYHDTGGILSMESIKCGTPIVVTRSLGSEEIFNHQEDAGAFFIDGYESLRLSIKHIDFLSAKPNHWKWTPELYGNDYKRAIENIIN
jgi:glycosyltransferase involved in cell wall biosynthesis